MFFIEVFPIAGLKSREKSANFGLQGSVIDGLLAGLKVAENVRILAFSVQCSSSPVKSFFFLKFLTLDLGLISGKLDTSSWRMQTTHANQFSYSSQLNSQKRSTKHFIKYFLKILHQVSSDLNLFWLFLSRLNDRKYRHHQPTTPLQKLKPANGLAP